MGNNSEKGPSSLLVEQSRHSNNSNLLKNSKYFSEEKQHKRNSMLKHGSEQQKTRSTNENKNKQEIVNASKQQQKSSIYFSLNKLQIKAEKNSPKQKMKFGKEKVSCIPRQRTQKITLVQKDGSQGKGCASTTSFDRCSRQIYLSPDEGHNKKKIIGIKENSLNKINRCFPKQVGSSLFKSNNPYQDGKQQRLNQVNVNEKQQANPLKRAKSPGLMQEKISSGHQFYFSKNTQPYTKKKQKKQGQKNIASLYIPAQNHKNPLGRPKLQINQQKKQPQQSGQYLLKSNPQKPLPSPYSSIQPQWSNPIKASTLPLNKNGICDSKMNIIRQKQYSICQGSQQNISKINIEEVQSFIKMEFDREICVGITNFVIEESVILRGMEEEEEEKIGKNLLVCIKDGGNRECRRILESGVTG